MQYLDRFIYTQSHECMSLSHWRGLIDHNYIHDCMAKMLSYCIDSNVPVDASIRAIELFVRILHNTTPDTMQKILHSYDIKSNFIVMSDISLSLALKYDYNEHKFVRTIARKYGRIFWHVELRVLQLLNYNISFKTLFDLVYIIFEHIPTEKQFDFRLQKCKNMIMMMAINLETYMQPRLDVALGIVSISTDPLTSLINIYPFRLYDSNSLLEKTKYIESLYYKYKQEYIHNYL